MTVRRKRRILRWTAVAFAAAAFAAPAAQAMPYNGQEGGTSPQTTSDPVSATPSDGGSGFSWADAGIGVAAAASVVLVAGGGVLVVRGTRRSRLAGT
jgi:uncharacterized iron-regulated membrane protein